MGQERNGKPPTRTTPWTRSQLASFLDLPVEFRKPGGGRGNHFDEQRFAQEQWALRRAHPIGRILLRRPEVKAILEAFEEERERALGAWVSNPNAEGLSHADSISRSRTMAYNARLKLVCTLARYAQAGFDGQWEKMPLRPTSAQRESAIKHAKGLLLSIRQGVLLDQSQYKTGQLRDTLTDLVAELRQMSKVKLRQKDRDAGRRHFLGKFANEMILRCGFCRHDVLINFAKLVSMPCEEKYARRVCKAASLKWKQWAAERYGPTLAEILAEGAS